MGAFGWTLIGLEVLWIGSVVFVGVRRAVRSRFLLVTALGWLVSLVIATTAQPAGVGLGVGVLIGAWGTAGIALATRTGVSFIFEPNKVYWPDETRPPPMENRFLLFLLACGSFAIVALAVR